jgi:hypothetical protein
MTKEFIPSTLLSEESTMSVDEAVLRVDVPAELQANQDLFAWVQRANKTLGDELGRAKGFVTADWKVVRNSATRPLLELTLTDVFTKSQVTEAFDPHQARNETYLGNRIHRLWGHLLEARSDRQIRQLEELAKQQEG